MANKDLPQGARPFGQPLRMTPYMAASAVYPGDFVALTAAGKVATAAASAALVGVAASYASGDTVEVMIYDHPDQLFVCQADSTEIDAQTDLNLNYNFVAGSPDTTYKISRHEVASSTGATDSILPLKVMRIEPAVDNALGAQVDVVCKINNHQLSGGTGTLGV
jgi:hypothetical protein